MDKQRQNNEEQKQNGEKINRTRFKDNNRNKT